jgi:hypothetical protein
MGAGWRTTARAVLVGFLAQGGAHAVLFIGGVPLPSLLHVLPFVLGGLAAGLMAGRPLGAALSALPYAAGWMLMDVAMAPHLVAPAPDWMTRVAPAHSLVVVRVGYFLLLQDGLAVAIGVALSATVCALLARRRATSPGASDGTRPV